MNADAHKERLRKKIKEFGLEPQCLCDGPIHSDVVVIAEAPGDREVEVGRPLIGGSGTALWNVLRKHGFTRNNVYITNVSKRQVSSMQNDRRHPINKHELQMWRQILHWELDQLPNAKYVLLLGNFALAACTGEYGITNWRGSVLPFKTDTGREFLALCTYNPAMVLREPKLELTFRFDCGKLPKIVKDQWVVPEIITHINPSVFDALTWIDDMIREGKPVSYDIETIANETACVGLTNKTNESMCINFRTLKDNRYSLEEECLIRRRLQNLFLHKDVRLVAQNNMFDASWLWFKDRIRVQPIYFDTMLAHHVLYPQLPHNLGYLTTQYTPHPFYKDEKNDWKEGGDINSFWKYNCKDTAITLHASLSLGSELKQQGLDKFFFDHVMRAQSHLVRMTVGGILVDVEKKRHLQDTVGEEVQRLLADFHNVVQEVVGDPDFFPNPRSPKQMSELLFRRLRLIGRGTSTDATNRQRMYNHPATTEPKRRVLRALDQYIGEQKFQSTYVETAIDDDNRLRCTYNQTGVQSAPGRLSSSKMLWRNSEGVQTGMNLQNQPERAYEMYIADKGYGLGYFDLSQAEARCVGWEAEIPTWMEQFERARISGDFDCHRALASEMFGIPYDQVPTFDRYDATKGYIAPEGKQDRDVTVRYVAKRCRHGLNYRMGPDRLSSVTGLTLADATDAYKRYHQITPELQRWWHDLEQEVKKSKTLFNAYGRRYIVLERLTPEALESIVAFKPQSTIGDKVVRVIYQSHDDPRWPLHARMWLNIHDALIVLAPRHKLQLCLSIMKKYAEEPIMIKGRQLIIPAECKIGYENEKGYHSWATLKPIDIQAAA